MESPLRVAITGSTGLLGTHLRERLHERGHTVHRVVRSREAATGGDIYYSPSRGEIDAEAFEGVDVVFHLGGHPIGEERWTSEVRERIRDSRVEGTRLIAEACASRDDKPAVLVTASGVHVYGDRGDELLDERSAPGSDWLAQVCVAWEAAAAPAADAGIRVVHARTGLVLGKGAPLIEKIELPFKLGVGGRVGSGRQWHPCISMQDEIRAMWFLAEHDGLEGPVNLAGPNPVTNAELTRALGEALHRPTVLPVPVFAIRLLYGEMGVSLATASLRVIPRKLLDAGFEYQHPHVRDALAAIYG